MNSYKLKISYIFNIIIVLLVVLSLIIMFGDINFMNMQDPIEESNRIAMLKYFTTDSNILVGIASLLLLINEKKVLKDKRKAIKPSLLIFKYISTISVMVTFLTVFIYLGPGSSGGIVSMLTNSNLFFHCIIPLLAFISFVFFERSNSISKKYIKYGVIPVIIYAFYYMFGVLTHLNNGSVSIKYDWYWFVQRGIEYIFIVFPVMILGTYLLSYIIYILNNKKEK